MHVTRWSGYPAHGCHTYEPPSRVGIAWLILAASLPLQWYTLVQGPLGSLRAFHLAALLFVGLQVTSRGGSASLAIALRSSKAFVIPILYWLVLLLLATSFNRMPTSEVFQQTTYGFIALVGCSYFLSIPPAPAGLANTSWQLLRWSSTVAVASFSIFFLRSAIERGIDPLQITLQAIRNGDPALIEFALFRPTFLPIGATQINASLRHEIFAAILLMMWVSLYAAARTPLRRTHERIVFRLSIIASFALIIISLSRSVILALLGGLVMSPVRSLLTGRLTKRRAALIASGLAVTLFAALSGTASVIWTRFVTDRGSYDERLSALSSSFDASPLFGGTPSGVSAHNFIMDAWLQGGILTAMAATAAFTVLASVWAKYTFAYVTSPTEQPAPDDATLAVIAAGLLPIVRLLTAGGGVLHLTEWFALAFFGGCLATIARERAPLRDGSPSRRSGLPLSARALSPSLRRG